MTVQAATSMGSEGCINELLFPSDPVAAKQPEREILEALQQFAYPEHAVFAVKLALEEAVINAIKHGNQCDPNKFVTVRYDINGCRAVIIVADEGDGFDPDSVPDPTAEENLSKPCGRGIMLMRAYMDEVRYSRKGNMVRMVKYNRSAT